MRDIQVDWRHWIVAGILLILLGGLLWKWTLGSAPAQPTASAPKGSNPSRVAPDSP